MAICFKSLYLYGLCLSLLNQLMAYKKILFLSTSLLSFTEMFAQSANVSSGGNATNSAGSVSYTVGQNFYTTVSNNNGSVLQGVQQAYIISVVTSSSEAEAIDLKIHAFPNPASDILTVTYKNEASIISYQLTDIEGSFADKGELKNSSSEIDMRRLSSGVYLLKIIDNGKVIEIFKIIKN